MKKILNEMKIVLPSLSVNEGIARATVAAFCSQLDPTAVDIADVKCAVSEAITNCIVHGYKGRVGNINITLQALDENELKVIIKDKGVGIEDVKRAREPLYTTDAENERSGMGFTVMESFMDKLSVRSKLGSGTVVTMTKRLNNIHSL